MSRFSHLLRKSIPAGFLLGILFGVLGTVSVSAAMRGSLVFGDIPAGAFYDQAVGDLYGLGIIKGKGPTTFAPNDPVTRGEVAVLLHRLRNELKGLPIDAPTASSSSYSSVASSSSSSSVSSSSSSTPVVTTAGTLQFTTDKFAISKTAPKVSFTVVRRNGTKGAVSVHYKTNDGTAKAGINYIANEGNINFANGEEAQTVYVQLKGGTPDGYNKDFTIVLSAPTGGAVLAVPTTLKVTLLDVGGVDPNASSSSSTSSGGSSTSSTSSTPANAIEFNASGYSVMENAGNVTITVRRTGSTAASATVNYATANRTGQAGTEYGSVNNTLTFAAGESSKTFQVPVFDRSSIDGNKTFDVKLTAPSGASLGSPSTSTVTIIDKDAGMTFGSGTLLFTSENFNAIKGASVAITVQRNGIFTGTSTVNYNTNSLSAVVNADYTQTSGTLTFLPGETLKTFFIPILSGATSDRQIRILLESPTGALLGSPNLGTVTIQ